MGCNKTYTIEYIKIKFQQLNKAEQINILWSALDYMNQYNGRTKWECVALGMGYLNDIDDDNIWIKF